MQFALANAAPANGVEVVLVDHAAQLAFACGLVAVDVIEGAARVEAGVKTQLHALGQPFAQVQACTGGAPVEVAGRVAWQGRGQALGLGAAGTGLVGVEQRRCGHRAVETMRDEALDTLEHMGAVPFAEGVVEKPRERVYFLACTAQALEETRLRFALDHKVRTRDQQLGRHLDGLGVSHHAVGRFIQAQQHGHRNRSADQRVGHIRHDPLGVMGEQARFDVAVDEEVAAHGLEQFQARPCEGHIQLYLERR
ncbi:hypothetical protein D3C81_729080 [compost metagenome]